MKFTKMHGIGNDYVYVNCFEETVTKENVDKIIRLLSQNLSATVTSESDLTD